MIFLTVGSQKFQFDRLLKKVDELVRDKKITEEVFAQSGESAYQPQFYAYKNFLDRDEFSEKLSKCDIVLTHGGTGVIVNAIKSHKKVIAVARLKKYGEHVDDHQLQIIDAFSENNFIVGCDNLDGLEDAIKYAKEMEFNSYISNTKKYLKEIREYIDLL